MPFRHPGGKIGGAEEDRTPDPLYAIQVLSQLSYSPIFGKISGINITSANSIVNYNLDGKICREYNL